LLPLKLKQSAKEKQVANLYKRRTDVFNIEPNGSLYFPSILYSQIFNTIDPTESFSRSSITMTSNHLGGCVAFKIKTTHPKNYGVKPLYGVLRCRESLVVSVTRNNTAMADKREKFRIECLLYKTNDVQENDVLRLFQTTEEKRIHKQSLQVLFTAVPIDDHYAEQFHRKCLHLCWLEASLIECGHERRPNDTFVDCVINTK
jgi:hypothetical protein